MKRMVIIAALAAALAGCGKGGQANNAVTSEESAGLNNTAEMLDASPDSLVASNEAPLGNGDIPATNQSEQPASGKGAAKPR